MSEASDDTRAKIRTRLERISININRRLLDIVNQSSILANIERDQSEQKLMEIDVMFEKLDRYDINHSRRKEE